MADVDKRVLDIFGRLTGDRAEILRGNRFPYEIRQRIQQAIDSVGLECNIDDPVELSDVGFHLVDWNSDAAFLVALMLFPDEFSDEEICDGVDQFLIHAPAHCIEAARVGGYSTENPFVEDKALGD